MEYPINEPLNRIYTNVLKGQCRKTWIYSFLLIIIFTVSNKLIAQTTPIKLTFTAEENYQHVLLDSILISNSSNSTDTVLLAPDTILDLSSLGLTDPLLFNYSKLLLHPNIPNPFTSETNIRVELWEPSNVVVNITDIMGRSIENKIFNLRKGLNIFNYSAPRSGIFLFTIYYNNESKSIRMISTNDNYESRLDLVNNLEKSNFKSLNSEKVKGTPFSFNPGDTLLVIGYTQNGTTGKYIYPTKSQIIYLLRGSNAPCNCDPTIDYMGKTYNTIQINNQCWLRENLDVGTFIDAPSTIQTNNGIIEKYCYYNIPSNCDIWGALYSWEELMQYNTTPGSQGICPPGWAVPTGADWALLEGSVDSQYGIGDPIWNQVSYLPLGYDVGYNLKSTNLWVNQGYGVDIAGFKVVPSGQYESSAYFTGVGTFAIFWTSTISSNGLNAEIREFKDSSDGRIKWLAAFHQAYSLRCIKKFTCGQSIIDSRDGKTYGTVQIGSQCWMSENLNYGNFLSGSTPMEDNGIIEKYCYDNLSANCDTYGGLYQWDELMNYSFVPGSQGICPSGFHIPTDEEWKELEGYSDSQYPYGNPEWDQTGQRGLDAGSNLKSISGWTSNGNGTDQFGFTVIPGGLLYYYQDFQGIGKRAAYWSSSSSGNNTAWSRIFSSDFQTISRLLEDYEDFGYSVRCIKDCP